MCALCKQLIQIDNEYVEHSINGGDIPDTFNSNMDITKINGTYWTNRQMDCVWKVMSEHQPYLISFLKTHYTLLTGDGPLPVPTRHFIAILASAQLSCSFLVDIHKEEFLRAGGNAEWVKDGLEASPIKIQKLYELNRILAHQPWLVTQGHIAELTKPGDENWSLSELVYAIVLMIHFHLFSSFIESCVLMEEVTKKNISVLTKINKVTGKSIIRHTLPYDNSLEKKRVKRTPHIEKVDFSLKQMNTWEGKHEKQLQLDKDKLGSLQDNSTPEEPKINTNYGQFGGDIHFEYSDFDKKDEETNIPLFFVQDFNWDEQGYSVMSRFYSDITQLLDDKFRTIYNMTYITMGRHSSIDTSLFRRAAWNYTQSLWGMRHDDYDYSEVDDLLNRNLKNYLKNTSCYPERSSKDEYIKNMKDSKADEKIHLMMLTGEAKFQSCILYSMRAMSTYFNHS